MSAALEWPLIVWVVAWPFVWGMFLTLDLSRARAWSSVGLAGTVAAAVGLSWQVLERGPQQYFLGGWKPPLGIALACDGLSAAMLLMTAVVGVGVHIYAGGYFRHAQPTDAAARFFWPLWMFLLGSLNALFVSADLFNLYVTLELVTLAGVALVALAHSHEAQPAALRYLLAALAGSMAYLLGVALLYGQTAQLNLAALASAIVPGPVVQAAAALILTGLALKSALFPLHFWLPAAHASAPAPVSALLSALVVKASYYMVLRLWIDVFAGTVGDEAIELIGLLGAAAVIAGSLAALFAARLKLLVAYSTVAQLGYLFVWLGLAVPAASAASVIPGAALFALSHALAKAALFLAAGTILAAAGHDRIDRLGEVAAQMPVVFFAMALAGISLMGLPPSGGFVAKWMLLAAAMEHDRWGLVVVVMLGGLLAAAYLFRVFEHAFTGSSSPSATALAALPQRMHWTPLVLALAVVLLGLGAAPLVELTQVGHPLGPSGLPEQVLPLEDAAGVLPEEPAGGSRNESADGSHNKPAVGSRNESADGLLVEPAVGSRNESAANSRNRPADGLLVEPAAGSHNERANDSFIESTNGSLEVPARVLFAEPAPAPRTGAPGRGQAENE